MAPMPAMPSRSIHAVMTALVVPHVLNAVADRGADQGAFLPADDRARDRTDDGAARAALRLRPVVAKGGAGGKEKRDAENACLNSSADERSHKSDLLQEENCEADAGTRHPQAIEDTLLATCQGAHPLV